MKQLRLLLCSFLLLPAALPALAQGDGGCKAHKHQNWFQPTKSPKSRAASVSISDSIDLIKHTLFLDLTDFNTQEKTAECTIEFIALTDGITAIPFDLKGQQVDSVTSVSGALNFDYSGEKLTVELPSAMQTGDMGEVTVYYRSGAVVDPSGFGGFYWNANIAYNIGVAFSDWPPSYGRTWIPCFDNFVEKSTYEFNILTAPPHSAYCNGLLVETDTLENGILWHWVLDKPISSYLASVAVSDYVLNEWAFESITGDTIPVYLISEAADAASLANSFANLESVFNAFENWFGPYRWPKIGYSMTPVGAMEHATNIAYPPAILSNPSGEPVMAHELAHEWFGNLVTCNNPKDMWLNEGWAEFLSILVYEVLEGQETYKSKIRNVHREMLHKAHYLDGEYLAMNNVTPETTYGEHVYQKGALMAHTLRGYLGDSLFFDAMTQYIDHFEFKNSSSEQLRDFLNSRPGIEVSNFFDDWIFQPGWAQFSAKMTNSVPTDTHYEVSVEITQRLKVAAPYQNVPLQICFMDDQWNVYEAQVMASDVSTQAVFDVPFDPVFVTLNRDEKLSIAVTATEEWVQPNTATNFPHSMLYLTLQSGPDSVLIRAEHNWVGTGDEGIVDYYGHHISRDRFWRITGIPGVEFEGDARFTFDSRNTASGNLDTELRLEAGEGFNENNLVLFYRPNENSLWELWEEYTTQTLGPDDNGFARLTAHNFAYGDYTFGYPMPVGILEIEHDREVQVFPNPTFGTTKIRWNYSGDFSHVAVIDASGRSLWEKETNHLQEVEFDASTLAPGSYSAVLFAGNRPLASQSFIVK